jgi:hypothetical protein
MKKHLIFIMIPLMFACGGKQQSNEQVVLDSLSGMGIDQPVVSQEVRDGRIQQIPSPLEMSALIKESGARYNSNYLNEPENYSKYNSGYKRGLNLGIYATDLGYSNLYEESQQSILYVGAIKELADELRIGQYFNFETIERLAEKRDLDSLLLLSTQNFNDINDHFREQQRPNLSALMLIGGWIEALHIACRVANLSTEHVALKEKIGEQKIVISKVKELLEYFIETDKDINNLYSQIIELEAIFDNISIEESYGEPTYEEVDGVLVIKDNSTTNVNISDEAVDLIRGMVNKIRIGIIS